jgi:hypothetical protein
MLRHSSLSTPKVSLIADPPAGREIDTLTVHFLDPTFNTLDVPPASSLSALDSLKSQQPHQQCRQTPNKHIPLEASRPIHANNRCRRRRRNHHCRRARGRAQHTSSAHPKIRGRSCR